MRAWAMAIATFVVAGCAANDRCVCSGDVDGIGYVDIACGATTCTSGRGLRCIAADTLREEAAICGASGCGDGVCTSPENAGSCPPDCPSGCGDGVCSGSESAMSCAADCGPVCGDGMCTAGESCGACAGDCGACPPELVDVQLIGAIVQPWADGGETWDGFGSVSADDQRAIVSASLRTGDPYVIVATVLGLIANSAWMDVDVHGNASIAVDGSFLTMYDQFLDAASDDTPDAEWVGPPGWRGVPMSRARVRLVLYDEDVSVDDRIGTVELNVADLQAAYRAGRIYPVAVASQGTPVLFVRISVTASP